MNQQKTWLAGALLGGLGVALGAFGAHALKDVLTASGRLDTFELAVRYQFYHAFALLVVGLLQQFLSSKYLSRLRIFFIRNCFIQWQFIPAVFDKQDLVCDGNSRWRRVAYFRMDIFSNQQYPQKIKPLHVSMERLQNFI